MDPKNTNPNQRPGFRPGGGFGQNRPGGFNRGGRFQGRDRNMPQEQSDFFEKVVQVNRVSKKTKGGDKRSLSVLVVVGDRKGKVGVGLGKAADVQSAVRKATTYARKHLFTVPLIKERTIPHDVYIKLGAARLIMKPAPEGTGVIAGGPVRVVVEAAGVRDIVSKILGTNNKASNVYATLAGLKMLTIKNRGSKKEEVKSENAKKSDEKSKEKKILNQVQDDKEKEEKKK